MRCGEIDLEAIPAAEKEDEVDWTAMCELEAAEALAGMSRGRLGSTSQDRANVTSTSTTIPVKNFVEKIPSTSCQLDSEVKSRPKLTQAEKEERKIRRILANRESARETIRRRKAIYQELTRKAADVVEENEILKKEKAVAVDKYNSLKGRNEFLKAKLAEVKKSIRGTRDEAMASAEDTCPTKAPSFMNNQPSTIPYAWPPILPSSEVYQFQGALGLGSNLTSSSHFALQHPCMIPCSHQGQENSLKTSSQGPQLLVLAVPWLLPFQVQGTPSDFNSGTDTTQNPHSSLPHEDNYSHPSSNGNMNVRVSHYSSSRPVEIFRSLRNGRADHAFGAHARSIPESIRHDQFCKSQEPQKTAEDAITAIVARRRRRELMKMKKSHFYNDLLRYSDPG